MSTQDLKQQYEDAEQDMFKLQAERDDRMAQVRAEYDDQLRAAQDDAAAKQKAWLDAEAADALRDRPDGEAVADALGLSLEE